MLVKIPVPIMLETTSAVALTTPSWRRREDLAVGTLLSILGVLPPPPVTCPWRFKTSHTFAKSATVANDRGSRD